MTDYRVSDAVTAAVHSERRDVARWMLSVLETGRALGPDRPFFGKDDDEICARVRVLRGRLGHTDPLAVSEASRP